MDKLIVAALCLALGGCARMPSIGWTLGQHLPCNAGPIILDNADSLSRHTAEQIVALNEAGARLCDWKPPSK